MYATKGTRVKTIGVNCQQESPDSGHDAFGVFLAKGDRPTSIFPSTLVCCPENPMQCQKEFRECCFFAANH